MGIAVFQDRDLIYWSIKVLRGKWSSCKLRNTEEYLMKTMDRYDINALLIKRQLPSRSSRHLRLLVAAIKDVAKKRKAEINYYELGELKTFFGADMKINKMDVAGAVVCQYKFLNDQLERERNHKHPYFIRMFEAIAAGILTVNRFNR